MTWDIERIINFGKTGQFTDGFARFGFHDTHGTQFVVAHKAHWIGALSERNLLVWTVGRQPNCPSAHHLDLDIEEPTCISESPDGALVVTERHGVHKLDMTTKHVETLLRTSEVDIGLPGNAVVDDDACLWINDICGCKIHKYTPSGELLEILGTGEPGFTPEDVAFERASFSWIYDLRKGHDGNLYVLDSRNYAVRMLDIKQRIVTLVAGTGEPGYSGDGGDPRKATLGGSGEQEFDGPWSLSLDEEHNIYVGDTQNHVVRMVERETNTITTIAGNPDVIPQTPNSPNERDPFKLSLPRICGLDYHGGRLFIPEWDGDLVVLKR